MKAFCHDLNQKLSSSASNCLQSLDNKVSFFSNAIKSTLDYHAPICHGSKIVSSKPFTTPSIMEARRVKRRAERRFRKSRSDVDKSSFNAAARNLIKVVRTSQNKFYSDKLEAAHKDSRATFKIINSLLSRGKKKILPEHTNKQQLANGFAQFFQDKVSTIVENIPFNPQRKVLIDRIFRTNEGDREFVEPLHQFSAITPTYLKQLIQRTKMKFSSVDGIPPELLSQTMMSTSSSLLELINMSLCDGIFPDSLKTSHITAIVKDHKGDTNSFSNYRPVSTLPILSKFIEKCILDQVTCHIENNNLDFKYQSGFKKHHSCETALLKIYEDVLGMLKPKNYILVLFLDFSAAFDTVEHGKLVNKLETNFFIRGTALNWFKEYLKNRTFHVTIDGVLSDPHQLKYGVPQGSVLGPVLFTLYTQELSKIIAKHGLQVHMYADDVQLYLPCNGDEMNEKMLVLRECFNDIVLWAEENCLKLNNSKSKLLTISTRSTNNPHLSLQSSILDVQLESIVKNLGFSIDSNLTFSNQINKVCQCGFYLLKNLWRISSKLSNVQLKIQIVKACILPHIDYCNSLYVKLPNKQLKKLQRLMNASLRFIYNLRISDDYSITDCMKRCHFLPVEARVDFKICLMAFKCLNGLAPRYLDELLHLKSSLDSLRVAKDKYLLDKPALDEKNYKNRRFSIIAPRIWNSLPYAIRSIKSVDVFISKLKTHLYNKHFEVVTVK